MVDSVIGFIIDSAILFGVGSFFGIVVGLLIRYNEIKNKKRKVK